MTRAELGPLFLAGRLLNVGSYAIAERLAGRIGLLRTMVYTHLPSSLVLLLLASALVRRWSLAPVSRWATT